MKLLAPSFLVLLAACGEEPLPPCDHDAPAPEGVAPPTFTEVRTQVFRGCGFSRCHPDQSNPPGGATITAKEGSEDRVYESLVGAPSSTDIEDRALPDVPLRVVPSQPSASFLMWKLIGHDPDDPSRPVAGERMPQGCSGESCLSCDRIQMVWRWIAAGAAKD